MEKREIIIMYLKGMSFRMIEKETKINRKTIAKICRQYDDNQTKLQNNDLTQSQRDDIIRTIVDKPKYDTSKRVPRKMTVDLLRRLNEIVEEEIQKTQILGTRHKQKLDGKSVHEMITQEGYDINYRTMMTHWKKINEKAQEAYVRQEYPYGMRLEYDFGEVKLSINNKVDVYHLAVLSAPASGFRWAYLYRSQKMEVFLDSHVQFFEMTQGVYTEVVYDNMRNVVSKFVGRNKEFNQQLVQMSIYYGFDIIATNPRSGNEKGSVERSVEVIRRRMFTKKYKFDSFEQAQAHLQTELLKLNQNSKIEEEKTHLRDYKAPYELSTLVESKVDKYSCLCLDNNYYSVPDYLVGLTLSVKKYYDHYDVFSNHQYVCTHKKIDGVGQYQLDLLHYLKTLSNKPGALKNSLALKQCPKLNHIYQTYFKEKNREFIELLLENSDKQISELAEVLNLHSRERIYVHKKDDIEVATQKEIQRLNQIYGLQNSNKGGNECPLKH